jgi:hypothetical protein
VSLRELAPVFPHGELEELLDDVWFVTGSVRMPGPIPVLFSRNMVVLRHGGELTLVNTLRLDDERLAKLDELGEVKNVIRLAGFHGMDDPFYKDRYGATVSVVDGQIYAPGFKNTKAERGDGYLEPDVEMSIDADLPISGARLITIDCLAGEGLLLLERDGGILISGDSLQNWATTNEYFSFSGKVLMKLMGFIKPHQVGPGWLKQSKPDRKQIGDLLELEFDKLLPGHGDPVIGGAREKLRPAIDRVSENAAKSASAAAGTRDGTADDEENLSAK